jgi:glyoxylase-like metal-dependent hydrolase (beta-lactamase superfamily II)
MIFRQLFEEISSTYTYLFGCEDTGEALLVDPVLPTWQRDLNVISDLGLKLKYTVETHIHADHLTSAKQLQREAGSRIAGPALDGLPCTQVPIEEGKPFQMASVSLMPIHTPGHTDNHMAYHVGERVLTGDALMIDGCGRTDFQNGDSKLLYHSVTEKLFGLPDDHLVYPAHDYKGRHVSCIAQEKERNPRLGGGKSLDEFVEIMANLDLAYPKFIDYAVPGNRECGECPEDLPGHLEKYCGDMQESLQG